MIRVHKLASCFGSDPLIQPLEGGASGNHLRVCSSGTVQAVNVPHLLALRPTAVYASPMLAVPQVDLKVLEVLVQTHTVEEGCTKLF